MTRSTLRQAAPFWIAVRIMLILTVVLGIAYPLLVTGIGQAVFAGQANGSLVRAEDGRAVGSSLIGQPFVDADGNPAKQYFQPRPSMAVGESGRQGYDPTASAGSNLGPENPELVDQIEGRREQVAEFNGVPGRDVPVDALTASGSGLDPHISLEYARLQVHRVAEARGLSTEDVTALVDQHTAGRDLGFLGEPRVNVVELNLALDALG